MKMMKRVICAILCMVLVFLMTACGSEIPQEETQTIVFTKRFLMVVDASPEEWIEDLNNMGANQYERLCVNDDNEAVTMEITAAQREYWLSIVEKGLNNLQKEITALNGNYQIAYSSNYSHIDIYYNLEMSLPDAGYYVVYADAFCIFGQLLNGVDATDWFVSCNIYNSDTGKLVTSGDSETGLYYDTDDWEASK